NFQQNKQANTIDGYTTIGPTEFLSKTQSIYNSSYWGYNLSGDVLYQHRFPKRRRTLSLDVSGTFNNKTGDATQTAISSYGVVEDSTSLNQQANSSTSSYTVSGDASYTEPAGKTGMVQINYSPSYTWNKADKETSNYDSLSMAYSGLDTLLSNKYDNTYMTHRGGVSYRYSNRAMHFMLGVDAQYALLSGQEVFPYSFSLNRSFINVLPHAMFTYRFKNNSNLRLFYRTSTSPPTVTQLQSVIDNSNPLLLTTGNPDLKQSYTHNVMLRYGLAGGSKEQAFFAFAAVSYTQQYVANSTIIAQRDTLLANDILLRAGSQLTQPVNLNGNLTASTFLTYGLPIPKIKCNLNLNAGFSFSGTPGLVNGLRNVANTYNANAGFVLGSNISEKIDFTLSYTANYNVVRNTLQTSANSNYFNHTAGVKFNWLFWKGFVFNTNLLNNLYAGVSDGYNLDVFLWNASLGYKFLKDQSLEVKAGVNDILNQNTGITRTITDTYIEDSKTAVLKRYLLVTITYNIRYFNAGQKPGKVKGSVE
ncbi:MAG TPA: outer membrane beta-barrel protein, partial [Chitinophagales bacterium]|nr:outer membrane beta-barrel protein [Chitinophagales bacterium]